MDGRTRAGRIKELKDSWYKDSKNVYQAAFVLENMITEADFLLSDCKALRSCLSQARSFLLKLPLDGSDVMMLVNKIDAVLESTK